jgi:predicted deacetylase
LSYETIVDAIAKLNVEDESGIFVVVDNEGKATLRKDEDYKTARMGEVVYGGQVGTVAGLPVVQVNGINGAYVMTKDAVKLLLKKDIEVGTERDEDTCINSVYVRAFYICALHNATKICKITD